MSLLSQFNNEVAALMPAWAWDYLQITFGLAVFFGSMFQRAYSHRFMWEHVVCKMDGLTTWLAQLGLSVVATISLLVAVDGMLPGASPPRTFVVIFMAAYFCIQVRIIYQTVSETFLRMVGRDLKS